MSPKVLLISPKTSNPHAIFWNVSYTLRESSKQTGRPILSPSYPLSLPVIANYIGKIRKDADIRIIDENVSQVTPAGIDADLVGISSNTLQAERAFQLAKEIKEHNKNIKVLIGGAHFGNTRNEEIIAEALTYADSIVIGESDNLWGGILEDFSNNRLRESYFCGQNFPRLDKLVLPRFDLLSLGSYLFRNLETSRGCNKRCSFCNVTTKLRFKNPDNVVAEIKHLREIEHKHEIEHRSIFFTDNLLNPIRHMDKSLQLMEALVRYKEEKFLGDELTWFGQVNSEIGMDDCNELLDLMVRSGAKRFLIGFESFHYNKGTKNSRGLTPDEKRKLFLETIKKLRGKGVDVIGSFVTGFDDEPESVFSEINDFVSESGLVLAQVTILTPFPGTRDFGTFKEQGRLIKENGSYGWSRFNGTNAIIAPKGNGIDKQEEYYKLLKRIYSNEAINKRISVREEVLQYGPQELFAEQVTVKSFQEVALSLSKHIQPE